MSGFKLLAIKPLIGCSKEYLKILQEGQLYKFYNDYKFYQFEDTEKEVKEDGNINYIEYTPSIPDDLYQVELNNKRKLNVNISSIVGMNGSGKSTLTELFYMAIYLIAESQRGTFLKANIEELINESKLLLSKINNYKGISKYHINNEVDLGLLKNDLERNEASIEKIIQIYESFKIEIIYELDSKFYKFRFNGSFDQNNKKGDIQYWKTDTWNDEVPSRLEFKSKSYESLNFSEDFFYTVAVNYAIHGFNSLHIGNWVDTLFHKNDGYQVPLVINPMRDEGNFNINTENHLLQSRLLSNLLLPLDKSLEVSIKPNKLSRLEDQSLRNLAKGKIAKNLFFEIDKSKATYDGVNQLENYRFKTYEEKLWLRIEDKFLPGRVNNYLESKINLIAKGYIINKIKQIVENYRPYRNKYKAKGSGFRKVKELLDNIEADNSHITFKIKQAMNFLNFNHSEIFALEKMVPISHLSDMLRSKKYEGLKLINLVPPSFLKVKVLFSDNMNDNLDFLSSGEKQRIFANTTILYHLKYLDSVEKSEELPNKYSSINLILDEIELYFHPEFQRIYISNLLKDLKKLNLKSIKNINLLFLTHSPFILSDLPSTNTLRLKVQEKGSIYRSNLKSVPLPIEYETFAANIHDLLANGFFMETLMGGFAENRIKEVIENIRTNSLSTSDNQIINHIGDSFLKTGIKLFKTEQDDKD